MNSRSYQLFLETLNSKVANKRTLAKQLMELLCIEKEAVYRRLRREVMFSFSEIELISQRYQISLDYIMGYNDVSNMFFHLIDYDFLNTPTNHIQYTEKFLEQATNIKNDPHSETGSVYNILPTSLIKSKEHRNLYHFILYKWMYNYGKYSQLPLFANFTLPEHMYYYNDLYREQLMDINYTYYIFDENIFLSLVKDIRYFKTINYITLEEVEKIKAELIDYLSNIEQITLAGKFETGKRVDFFVTEMSVESSYGYIDAGNCTFSFIKLFNLTEVTSPNKKNIPRIKEWLQSHRKSSAQISVSGELQRIQYFKRQREIIEGL